jgi:hypothetical protein
MCATRAPGFDNSPTIAAWMKAHSLNASTTQQYFWKQMTAQVLPHLNRTLAIWRADSIDRSPHPETLPPGSIANVYVALPSWLIPSAPRVTKNVRGTTCAAPRVRHHA